MPAAGISNHYRNLQAIHNGRKAAFSDPRTPATVLLTAFRDAYPDDEDEDPDDQPMNWSLWTIRTQIEDDFNIRMPEPNQHKLMAAISVTLTDDFFRSAKKFMPLANAFNGDVDFETLDIADVDECAWAMNEAMLLSQEDGDNPFSEEVQAYVAARLREEGYIQTPRSIAPFVSYAAEGRGLDEDDPKISTAVWERQSILMQETDGMVALRMQDLAARLKALPLEHGDSTQIVEAVRSSFSTG